MSDSEGMPTGIWSNVWSRIQRDAFAEHDRFVQVAVFLFIAALLALVASKGLPELGFLIFT